LVPLMIAISFHQFFEGVALASVIFESNLEQSKAFGFLLFYSCSTPIGGVIGISLREGCTMYSCSVEAYWGCNGCSSNSRCYGCWNSII
jgi:solute carrier family 39 (zinc transporter), member 1/2/3